MSLYQDSEKVEKVCLKIMKNNKDVFEVKNIKEKRKKIFFLAKGYKYKNPEKIAQILQYTTPQNAKKHIVKNYKPE